MKSIDWPSASLTKAFFMSERRPGRPLNRLVLPFCTSVLTAEHRDPEQPFDRRLDLALGCIGCDAEHELPMLRQRRCLLGDQRTADDLIHRLAR